MLKIAVIYDSRKTCPNPLVFVFLVLAAAKHTTYQNTIIRHFPKFGRVGEGMCYLKKCLQMAHY